MSILRTFGWDFESAEDSFVESDIADGAVFLVEVFERNTVMLTMGAALGAYATLTDLPDLGNVSKQAFDETFGEAWIMDEEDLERIAVLGWRYQELDQIGDTIDQMVTEAERQAEGG